MIIIIIKYLHSAFITTCSWRFMIINAARRHLQVVVWSCALGNCHSRYVTKTTECFSLVSWVSCSENVDGTVKFFTFLHPQQHSILFCSKWLPCINIFNDYYCYYYYYYYCYCCYYYYIFSNRKIKCKSYFLYLSHTGQRPYKEVSGVVELYDMLLDGFRLEKPAHCSEEL